MGTETAAELMASVKRQGALATQSPWHEEDEVTLKTKIREQFETQGHPYYATARLWDDGIIDPADTRDVLGLGLDAALNAPIEDTRFGYFGCSTPSI